MLKTYDSRDLDVPIETIGWLAGFGLTAVLLIAAGGLGFVQGRAERLLFVAAVAFVVLRIMNGTMGLMIQRYQWGMSQRAVPIGQRKKAEWRIAAIALAMSLCIWIGGLIAWFSRWIGQTLLLFGAIGMTLFLLSAAASLTRKAPAAQLTAVLEEAGSLIIFLLFGTFALICGGIANTRTPVPADGANGS